MEKEFVPAHIQTILIYSAATKTTLPKIIHHPDDWVMSVKFLNEQQSISVNEEFYQEVSVGDLVIAYYVIGRFTGKKYLKKLET